MRSMLAYAVVTAVLAGTWAIVRLCGLWPGGRRRRSGVMAVTGRFDNRNWFRSHVFPLTRCGVGRVVVVTEHAFESMDGVEYVCPPAWAQGLLGRALSKLIWLMMVGIRFRPDLYMGYHLVPGALSTLIIARVFGRRACYQMTGGPIEVVGGGNQNENAVMGRLSKPSRFLERLALSVVGQFDLVVVRGGRARRYLAAHGLNGAVAEITGSVGRSTVSGWTDRDIDLIFAGRLTDIKQPEQFVDVVAAVARTIPDVRSVVVGSGPALSRMKQRARDRGVSDQIEFMGHRDDVLAVLGRAKVFVLNSRSEGMSLAMGEAMSCGTPAVVSDVGELGDLISNGWNGWLIPPNDVDEFARRIVPLLTDDQAWNRCSRAAADSVYEVMGVDAVSRRWQQYLKDVIEGGCGRIATRRVSS